MRYKFISLVWVLLLVAAGSRPSAAQQETDSRLRLTLEDIHSSSTFTPIEFEEAHWAEEGPVVFYIESDPGTGATHLVSYDLETDEQTRLIDGSNLRAEDVDRLIRIEEFEYSPDLSQVLIYTDSERVWRHNTKGYYYIYDIPSKTLKPVADRAKGFQMFAKFSPNGRSVGFVRNRNIFVVDADEREERQLTSDGSEGGIINGTSDWVYEEEFGLRDGWAWSPDSRRIAYVQLDESNTREFVMADLRGLYPDLTTFRYPKAGQVNSEIHVGVVEAASGENAFFDTQTWHAGGDSLEYIPSLGWTPEIDGTSHVWMFRLNRDQNDLDLLYGDPATMSVRTILEEENDTWLDVETSFGDLAGGTITFLQDGRHFVWLSERDGYRHLHLYKNDGTPVRQLTKGAWNVTSFHGLDEEAGSFYFTGTATSPLERHLYRGSIGLSSGTNGDVEEPHQITNRTGTHSIDMSRDLLYYIGRFSDIRTPSVITLHRADGSLIKELEGNEELQARLSEYDLPSPEFTEVPGADGTLLNAYVIKPSDFDPAVEYPMVMYVYGGPGSQTVSDSWGGSRYLWHAYLAENHDIIVASVDNRGTGGRSKDFKSAPYRQLGVLEAQDQIAAARYFGGMDYVDEERIGMWGWSYGGYLTLMSMLSGDGPETFTMGVAVAPVTDWGQYDTIYTERYMSTPRRNPAGYRKSAPVTYADRLSPEQELLIVHGDLDDNVHFQNAVQMIDALQESGKQFDMMMYPGRDHGISGENTRLHLYTLITDYIDENL